MKNKITVLFDQDGVLCDLLPSWLSLYNQETGENTKEEEITQFNLYDLVKYPDKLEEALAKKDLFLNVTPYKDCVQYFKKIIKDKAFDVFIVTQVPRCSIYGLYEKRLWMKKYFKKFSTDRIISAHRKYLIDGDILIDDNPKHLKDFREHKPGRISIAMDHPYNRDAECDYRVSNWKALYGILLEIKQKRMQ
ncbi:hypothetical protein HYV49_05260 [Candidatus Pacearchaeota archaeon]|nr:hypothetical protein [Candidatus Pacearchaeota archaeon]